MEDKELIKRIQSLKAVKPTKEWAFWLKSNILERKTPVILNNKPQFKLVNWSFISRYTKVLVPSLAGILLLFTFTFAQFTLPGNVLYPLKTLSQNIRINLAPANQKPVIRLEVAKARLNDLMQVQNHQKEVSLIAQKTRENLKNIPQDIKKISSKKVALVVSQRVQRSYQSLPRMVKKTNLPDKEKTELDQTIDDTQKELLTYITDTNEMLNHCPSSLENRLATIASYFNKPEVFQSWTVSDIAKVRNLLNEVSADMKKGECLQAQDKIESIHQLMLVHSANNPVEDTTTLPSSD